MRRHQVLLAGRLLRVDRDGSRVESLLQGDRLRVARGEGRLDLGGDTLAETVGSLGADPLQEVGKQPAAEAPGHAEVPRQDRLAAVEPAVDVDLLERRRTVAIELGSVGGQGRLHRGQDLAGQLAAAGRVEAEGGAGLGEGGDQIGHESVGTRVHDMFGTQIPEELLVLHAADDVDQGYAVDGADLLQHLPEVRGGGRMNQRRMALEPHRFDHAQRGQRVDEAGRSFGRRRALGQH